jgi:hypothetical protein
VSAVEKEVEKQLPAFKLLPPKRGFVGHFEFAVLKTMLKERLCSWSTCDERTSDASSLTAVVVRDGMALGQINKTNI